MDPIAYMYFRVSTDDKGQDPESQRAETLLLYNELCPGAEVVEFQEEASAWQKDNRPLFKNMLSLARKNPRVKFIFCWDFDRIYRDRKRMVSLVQEYKKLDITIMSYRQKWLLDVLRAPEPWDSMIFDFLLNVIGWMGEEESKKKSDRVKAAYQRKKKTGKASSWGRPKVPDGVISKIQELKAQGLSIRKIQAELKKDKFNVSVGKISEALKC